MSIDILQPDTNKLSQGAEEDPSSLAEKITSFGEDALEKLARAERALRITSTLSRHAVHATEYANDLTELRTSLGELLAEAKASTGHTRSLGDTALRQSVE